MESYFLWAGIALCLFSLWAIARHDWLRLIRPMRRVEGEVIRHATARDDGRLTYAAVYAFTIEDGRHEATDAVWSLRPEPPLGTRRILAFPEGRPDLARPPRPWLWIAIYAVLAYLLAVLAARVLGWALPGD